MANKPAEYTQKDQDYLTSLAKDLAFLIVRNAIERESRILEERFRTLFDQSSDMIIICSLEGKILTLNHRVIQHTGYSYQDLINYDFWKLSIPKEEVKVKEFIKCVGESGSSRWEGNFIQKEGDLFPVDIQANTINLGHEKNIQIVVRDIIHFKKVEMHLQEQTEKLIKKLEDKRKEIVFFQRAVDDVKEYVIFTDPRGRIFFVNQAFSKRFNYHFQEILGCSFEFLFPSTISVKTIEEIFEKACQGSWRGKIIHTTKEGEDVSVVLLMKSIKDPQGRIMGLLGVSIDVEKPELISSVLNPL